MRALIPRRGQEGGHVGPVMQDDGRRHLEAAAAVKPGDNVVRFLAVESLFPIRFDLEGGNRGVGRIGVGAGDNQALHRVARF